MTQTTSLITVLSNILVRTYGSNDRVMSVGSLHTDRVRTVETESST